MRAKKPLRYYIGWVVAVLCAFNGLGLARSMFFPQKSQVLKQTDFTAAQSLAEYAASVYLTVDNNEDHQAALKLLFPSENRATPANGITQSVDHATALKPFPIDSGRLGVPVDVWLTVHKNSNKQDVLSADTQKHLRVTMIIQNDGKGNDALNGMPIVEPAPSSGGEYAIGNSTVQTSVSDNDKQLILSALQSFLPVYFSSTDPSDLQNALAPGTNVQPLSGLYQYKQIVNSTIVSSGQDKCEADLQVQVVDPSLSIPFDLRVIVNLVNQSGRYFVSGVGVHG